MIDAEKILLGQILQDNNIIYANGYSLTKKDFRTKENRDIFEALTGTILSGEEADIAIISHKLPELTPKIAKLSSTSAKNWQYYHKIIKETSYKANLRRLFGVIGDDFDRMSSEEIISRVETGLLKITRQEETRLTPASEAIDAAVKALEERIQKGADNSGWIPGISTGYSGLDRLCHGYKEDNLYFIGGRPSEGKTALVCNLIGKLLSQDVPVGFLSLESSENQIVNRLIAIDSGVEASKIQLGTIRKGDMSRIIDTCGKLYEKNLFIDDTPNASITHMLTTARAMYHIHGIKVLFIDYVQKIRHTNTKLPRYEQIGDISTQLKVLNRSLCIPIVATCQLTRDTQGKRPTLSSFRQSGELEQDADNVWFIHNEEDTAYLIVAKGRDTGVGELQFEFDRDRLQFRERYTKE